LKAIFESGDHLIWTVNKKLELTSYNKNYLNLIKNPVAKQKLEQNKNLSVLETIQNKEKKKFWVEKYKQVLKGKPNVFVHKSIIDNKEIYREIYLYPILLNQEVVEVSVIAQNITERIENENKILEQSAKLKAIFESGDQLMWTINKELKLTSFNKNYANSIFDFYGYYPQLGKSMRSNKTSEYHSIWDDKYDLAFQGKPVEFISERTQKNGSKIIRQILLYPIKDLNNQVIEVSGIGFDITENKINEEKITQSLKEKDVLLKEVHHRVKNNMQVISSILNLQSSYVKDTYALNLLKECQNRIKSMAFIHESLYQTKNFESVNFSEYVTTLSKNLVHTYSINTKKIKLILTLDKLYLSLDASIPCGLIINEIISNSLKYAFPDNRDGIIFVNLAVVKNKVSIEVGDNGIGIPDSVDVKNTQTLGLQLVDTLVEQINGTIKLIRKKGTIFSIEFNI
jgi:PAS domain S-box-containing protein